MRLKGDGVGTDPAVVDRWEGGLSWMAHPDEGLRRTSHALVTGGSERRRSSGSEVWLVDPLDADGIDEEVAALGPVAGVVVLSSLHRRHAARFADRYDVAVHLPSHLGDLAVDAPVERVEGTLADTGFRAIPTVRLPWREAVLHHPGRRTLVAGDALTTLPGRTLPGERLAVMPHIRMFPPRDALSGVGVERILVGHGRGVFEDAEAALEDALAGARRGAPRVVVRNLPDLLRASYVALRD